VAAGVALSARPALSIVVALQHEGASPEACIGSLLEQIEAGAAIEILVVGGTAGGWRAAEPGVPIETLEAPPASSLPQLLGRGLAASRGRLVAFTEAHVTFEAGWIERALEVESREEVAAVGGFVAPGAELGAVDRAVFLCDYAAFLPPVPGGETTSLPGCNLVFRRQVLEAADRPAEAGFWKTFLCDTLLADGEKLALDSSLGCRHHLHLSAAGWLRKRLVHGRCYGGMRRRGWSFPRRAIYAVTAPLVPLVLFARLVRLVWPRNDYRALLVSHAPLCFLAIALWVVGEWLGNLVGPGRSCQQV